MEPWKDTEEAARHVRLSCSVLEKLRVKGGGPQYSQRTRGARVVYHVDDLDAWMRAQAVNSTSEREAA